MLNPTGEPDRRPLRPVFDRRPKLGFHGSRVTSDAGLLRDETTVHPSMRRHDERRPPELFEVATGTPFSDEKPVACVCSGPFPSPGCLDGCAPTATGPPLPSSGDATWVIPATQPGESPSHAGDAEGDRELVANVLARTAHQDRCAAGAARPLRARPAGWAAVPHTVSLASALPLAANQRGA